MPPKSSKRITYGSYGQESKHFLAPVIPFSQLTSPKASPPIEVIDLTLPSICPDTGRRHYVWAPEPEEGVYYCVNWHPNCHCSDC